MGNGIFSGAPVFCLIRERLDMIEDLIKKNRSYRRFYQSEPVSIETLRGLVNLTRFCASGSNLQPLRYKLVNDPAGCADVYRTLGWAGFLKDWGGPAEGERPSAYIVVAYDPALNKNPAADAGIAAQTILLGATEQGLGGCMLGNVKRSALKASLHIPYEISLVIALGKPKEKVVLEKMKNGDVKYWRDEAEVHHVPKRALDDILL